MGLQAEFEWWQLWSCHFAHWNAAHAWLNVLAALPPLVMLRRRGLVKIAAGLAIVPPLLSLAILAAGIDGEYRGASGLIVALWVYVGLSLVRDAAGRVLLAAIGFKLIAEAFQVWPSADASFDPFAPAHYAGALLGAMAAVASGAGVVRASGGECERQAGKPALHR